MSHSRTDIRIAEFVVWSALAVYAGVWVVSLGVGLGGRWLLAAGVAAVYVGMHVFEMTRRNHCYLSADSTAFPVSLVVFSAAVLILRAAGHPPLAGKPFVLAWCVYSLAFMLGHLTALAYSAAVGAILTVLFRRRLAAERNCPAGAGAPVDRPGD